MPFRLAAISFPSLSDSPSLHLDGSIVTRSLTFRIEIPKKNSPSTFRSFNQFQTKQEFMMMKKALLALVAVLALTAGLASADDNCVKLSNRLQVSNWLLF